MDKKTKPKVKTTKKLNKISDSEKEELQGSEQKESSYYYDDSHGYKVYDPDEDEESDEDLK